MQPASHHRPRVAIYARYSSSLQKPTSIEDQVRLCKNHAASIDAVVIREHSDFETSAATARSRPGLDALLLDARRGHVDIILAEALDRISRDQEHIHGIHKRLLYWKVRLVTVHEGEIQAIHVSIGGYMNSAWIDGLRTKTRRGQIGAVHAGRIPGGLSFGYRICNRIDAQGRAIRGLREIDPDEASTVLRIYRLYADGESVRNITARLNREGVPGPRGRRWGPTTINGHRGRRNGVLNNELYCGRLVYGRQQFVRDPDTGKRQARPVPPDQWIVRDVPELRIVDDILWDRVQKRRQAGQDRRNSAASHTPLPFTGLVLCGLCGANFTIVKQLRYACHARAQRGTCSNPRGINATRLENQACATLALQIAHYKDPKSLLHRATAKARERHRQLSAAIEDRKTRIRRLLAGIESGAHSLAAHQRIVELEHEIAALDIERDALPDIADATPDRLATRLHQRLAALSRVISDNRPGSDPRRHALLQVARLIESIHIHPRPGRGNIHIELTPRLDALVGLAIDPDWSIQRLDPEDGP